MCPIIWYARIHARIHARSRGRFVRCLDVLSPHGAWVTEARWQPVLRLLCINHNGVLKNKNKYIEDFKNQNMLF